MKNFTEEELLNLGFVEVSPGRFKKLRTPKPALKKKKNSPYAHIKRGTCEIGGKKVGYRSDWERVYAHYLEHLKLSGEILEWEYEPKTFWFNEIKRGTRSYLPDFRVTELDGTKVYHEVKGRMTAQCKTKIKRFAKYYPNEILHVVREKEMNAIRKVVSC